jgi:hypothetical protein
VVTELLNPSAAASFGFPPASLVGRELPDFVSAFEAWRAANPARPLKQLMDAMADRSEEAEAGYLTWRVAVKQPGLDLAGLPPAAAAKQLRPAIMQVGGCAALRRRGRAPCAACSHAGGPAHRGVGGEC